MPTKEYIRPFLCDRCRPWAARRGVALALWAIGWAMPAGAYAAKSAAARFEPSPRHEITVRITGLVAEVTVRREFEMAAIASEPAGRRAVLELALPSSAELVQSTLLVGGAEVALDLPTAVQSPSPDTGRSGARIVRLHIERAFPEDRAELYLRYRAPLACEDGRFVLSFPGDDAPEAVAARVFATVRFGQGEKRLPIGFLQVAGRVGALRSNGAEASGEALAPAHLPWQIALGPASTDGAVPAAWALATRLVGGAAAAPRASTWWIGVCRPRAIPAAGFPSRLYLIVDRSRSMGLSGLSLARATVLGVIASLPMSTAVDVGLFARSLTWLYPIERSPTREMLDAIGEALSPGRMENGTSLASLLAALGARLTSAASVEPSEPGEPGTTTEGRVPLPWLVLATDGALDEAELARLPIGVPGGPLAARLGGVALLITRPAGEEPLSAPARQALVALVKQPGGVLRQVSRRLDRQEILDLADDLRRGGDLFDLRLQGSGGETGKGVQSRTWPDVLPPGEGAVLPLSAGASWRPVAAFGLVRGHETRVPVVVLSSRLDAAQSAHQAPARRTRPGMASPPPRPEPVRARWEVLPEVEADRDGGAPEALAVPRGELDRAVLRNALRLGFLPRARACYLTRQANDAASARLQGRLRLALHIERGELVRAEVLESTLAQPELETCVTRAAFMLDVPRPANRDQPALALVNLVFRPAHPGTSGQSALSAELDDELDVLLGRPGVLPSPDELLELGAGRPDVP